MEGWLIVCTLDGKETEADLYGVEQRIFRRLRDAQETVGKLKERAKRMEWEHAPPMYGVKPVNISGMVVSRGNQ